MKKETFEITCYKSFDDFGETPLFTYEVKFDGYMDLEIYFTDLLQQLSVSNDITVDGHDFSKVGAIETDYRDYDLEDAIEDGEEYYCHLSGWKENGHWDYHQEYDNGVIFDHYYLNGEKKNY